MGTSRLPCVIRLVPLAEPDGSGTGAGVMSMEKRNYSMCIDALYLCKKDKKVALLGGF